MSQRHATGRYVYNLGNRKRFSSEVVHAFEKANDVAVPYQICERRAGDITIAYANALIKLKKELVWKSETSLEEALRTVCNGKNI